MPVKLDKVPNELEYLMPSKNKKTIVLGDDAYEIVPLTEGQLESTIAEVSDIVAEITKNVVASVGDASSMVDGDATTAQRSALIDVVKQSITTLVYDGNLVSILATLLSEDADTIREKLTVPQLHHIAGVFWEQNFDFQRAPDGTVKNVSSLLETFGFGNQDTKVLRWANLTLSALLDDSEANGSLEQRVETVLTLAYEVGMLDEKPATIREALARERVSTPNSPSTTTSPQIDWKVGEESFATSQETVALEDTSISAKESDVPVDKSTPNGKSKVLQETS